MLDLKPFLQPALGTVVRLAERPLASLLGAEFSFLPAEVVAVAFPATVRRPWVSGAAVAADFVVQPDLLRQLFLHNIRDRHLQFP
jgi:hypothetical protein